MKTKNQGNSKRSDLLRGAEEKQREEEAQGQKGPLVAVETPMRLATRVVVLVPSRSLLLEAEQVERAVLEGFRGAKSVNKIVLKG